MTRVAIHKNQKLLVFLMVALVLVVYDRNRSRPVQKTNRINRTLVLYCYLEKVTLFDHAVSLKNFLELGVASDDPCDYVFIIQGMHVSTPIPDYKNIRVYRRTNTCYDFGAFGATIEWLGGIEALKANYDSVIFLNPTAFGPILPKYWPPSIHWSEIFTSRMKGDIHAVSVNLICVSKKHGRGLGSYPGVYQIGPMLEGL